MTNELPPELIASRGTTPNGDRRGSLVGDLVRRLSSTSDGEVVNTARALGRELNAAGVGFHELAKHIESPLLTDALKQKIFEDFKHARAAGYQEGIKAAEARQHGIGTFRNTDGKLDWAEVALFVQREKHRLPDKHHEFVDDMAARTVYGREPTPKQHQYLHSLFYKLGGKVT